MGPRLHDLSRSPERQPEVLERRGEGGGPMEEMADEAGALGALDIAGVVVDEQRRSGGGAETGEAAEIGGGLGFSRAKLGRDEDIGPKDGTQRAERRSRPRATSLSARRP